MDMTTVNTNNVKRQPINVSVKTPNFWALRRAKKRLPINNHTRALAEAHSASVPTYNGLRSQFQQRPVKWPTTIWREGGHFSQVAGLIPKATNVPTELELEQILNNRLLAKVRDTPIDLGVALGEYRETANFIASAMLKTVQAARAAKRGNLSEMTKIIAGRHKGSNLTRNNKLHDSERKMLDVIHRDTNRWSAVPLSAGGTLLALNYGLKPLVSDVMGASEYLSEVYNSDRKSEFHFRTRFPEQNVTFFTTSSDKQVGEDYAFKISGNAYARAVIDNPILYELDKLGLLNPISTGYELVPFSFVVDWFIPIGEWLRQFQEPKGLKFMEGYRTVKLTDGTLNQWTKRPTPAPGWNTSARGTEFYKKRVKLTSFPDYTLRPTSLESYRRRIANGSALLSQFLFKEDVPVGKPTRKDFRQLEPLGVNRSQFRRVQKLYR